ncbi:MAG: type II CRISPR RNA-guided endonuclease Cas9, partial [Bacilli bacterium]|nr:type II CRISPR RNA-guided endonuclease Cas9 [Bacilli bacterium]
MNENKFFVGLDVGTNSVGWAATDENYDLLRLKGKTAWGAHIFPEAESAGKRRLFRTSGRRLARRKRRIDLLNRLFEPLLKNQDENFLNRLEESAYILEDKKSEKTVHSLFGNKKLEKDFYTKYPTIWHLRKDMCDDKKEAFNDIRFVYLAVHHIIKYRGNFLLSGNIDPTKFDYSIFDGINAYFKDLVQEKSDEDINENFIFITPENSKKIVNILQGKESNKNSKKKILKELINDNETIEPFIQFFISLIVGGDFGVEKLGEEFSQFEKQKINITNFDEKRDDYLEMLGDKFLIVEYAKTIYDYVSLQEIIKGRPNLASAFANVYDSHQTQLKELKKLARLIDEKKGLAKTEKSMFYRLFYKKDEKNNYAAFVKHNTNESKKTSIHAFNKFVLEEISQHEGLLEENKTWLKLKKLAENDNLCETISRKSTSVIPHQLHENELVIILDNAAKRFPYIEEIKTKILKIFTFRIPYYCGPLNTQSSYSHVVKFEGKEKTVVLPWNFDEVVDKEKTRSKFMGSLTNECTYLIGENVLPRQSVIYQDYIIFNRLNSLIINGRACDQKTKMDVFYNLISKNKKTTINGLKKYLSQRYEIYKKDGVVISGLNENDDFNSESRALFSKHFDLSNHLEFKKVERIIYLLTIYSDDSNDALEVIEKENQKLTVEQKRFIKNFKSKGWGNLSGFLLQKLKWCDENAVCNSIYDLLKDTTENFMQILNNPLYDFKNIIAEKNEEKLKDLFDEDIVDEIIQKAPPKTRRSIISTIKIVDELVKVRKRTPDVISIEVTRGEEKKQKGKDGKEKAREKEVSAFLNSLKTCKEDFLDIPNLQTELSELDEKLSLKGKHIYLYFRSEER